MIILRYKYFNEGLVIRWPVPNPSLLLYPKIEKTNRFKNMNLSEKMLENL